MDGTSAQAALVIGAGPVGLALAVELQRQAIPVRIVDKKEGPSQHSKALGIFPRTLEVFDRMGIIDRFLAAGHRLSGLNVHARGKHIAKLSLRQLDTPYPFVLVLPQSQTEQILINHLKSHGTEIEWNRELIDLHFDRQDVAVELRQRDACVERMQCQWLLGCDGAHSTVRHRLGLRFRGSSYPATFLLADVRLQGALDPSEGNVFFHPAGVLAFIALGRERWRVIIEGVPQLGPDNNSDEPTLAELQALVDQRGPGGIRLTEPQWRSRFHIERRMTEQMRIGRVLLAGDAAHVCSPVGGQGMNLGIQDAANLGWKLAAAIKGDDVLLDSYQAERRPVAQETLELTDRMTRVVALANPAFQFLRNRGISIGLRIPTLHRRLARNLAELDLNYRESRITRDDWHYETARGPAAGERAPDGTLQRMDGRPVQIFELLRSPRHVMLVFAGLKARGVANATDAIRDLADFRDAIEREFGDRIEVFQVSRTATLAPLSSNRVMSDDDGSVHRRFDARRPCCYLIRPDGYVGYRASPPDLAKFRNYFQQLRSEDHLPPDEDPVAQHLVTAYAPK